MPKPPPDDGSFEPPAGDSGDGEDQTRADADQTAADSDQTAADLDEAASDSDQAASDSDQAASDRDLAKGGDREVHDASAGSRDRATEQRLEGVKSRAQGASSRDAVAKSRDRAAEARDRAADQLDRDLEARDAEWADRPGEPSSKASTNRDRAAADRRRAAEARRRAASDRQQAAEDRKHAARYRAEARQEHAALLRQVSIAETDPLTGARARAPGLRDLEIEINRARRSTGQLAVGYVDIVGLKAVNDNRGHAAGDALLETTVRLIRAHLRPYDVIIRIGGDGFVCSMSGATLEEARQRFGEIQADAAATGLGIKFGIAALRPGDGPSDVIERADAELLQHPHSPGARPRASAARRTRDLGLPRILVSGDRPEMRVIVADALAERYACEFASSPEEAGKALAGNNFDLLLCDLHSGGEAALSMARQTVEANLDTAVVLIAEEDDPVTAESAFEFGAFGYVVRPMPGQLLITTMNALRRRDLEIAQRAMSQNRQDRSQTIIDMAPIPIYAKDLSGRYVVANSKADDGTLGFAAASWSGGPMRRFCLPDQMEIGTESDRRVMEEKAAHEREDTVEIGGVTKVFKSVRFPLLDEIGEVDAVGGISVDITAETEALRLRDELSRNQREAIEELKLSRMETIEGLASALDLHDPSTGRHIERMAAVAAFLGSQLGFDPDRVELLRAAAPMHDVGKIGTSAEILRKPGTLTDEERTVMQRHTVVGHMVFSHFHSELSRLAGKIALTHHERFDGSGYPRGLAGEEIPIEGRIAAVADVFDALLSDRSYRPAFSVERAVAVIEEGRGTQFDPRIVDALLDHVEEVLEIRDAADSRGASQRDAADASQS